MDTIKATIGPGDFNATEVVIVDTIKATISPGDFDATEVVIMKQ